MRTSRAISLLCEGCNNARTTTRALLYFISPQLRLLPGNTTVTAAMTDTNLYELDLLIIADLAPSLTLSSSAPILSIQPGRRLHEARTVPDAPKAFVDYFIGTVAAITRACSQGEFSFCPSILNQFLGLIHRRRLSFFFAPPDGPDQLRRRFDVISHGQHRNNRSWKQARSIWLIHCSEPQLSLKCGSPAP